MMLLRRLALTTHYSGNKNNATDILGIQCLSRILMGRYFSSVEVDSSSSFIKGKPILRRNVLNRQEEHSDDSGDEATENKLKGQSLEDNYEEAELEEVGKQQRKNQVHRNYSRYDSYDSVENLMSINFDQNSSEQKSEIAMRNIMNKMKTTSIDDSLQPLSQMFRTREKRLSFQLINMRNSDEILALYEQEKNRIDSRDGNEDSLSADEVSLFFYFATAQKQYLSDSKIFHQILTYILEHTNDLSLQSIQNFVWSFGVYIHEFGQIEPSEQMKKNLSDTILKQAKHFSKENHSSICFALSQILSEAQDNPLVEPIVDILADNTVQFIQTLQSHEIVTMILTFAQIQFSNNSIISKYVNRLTQIRQELSDEDIQKACCALGEMNYGNSQQFSCLIKDILDREKGKCETDISCDTACGLIFTLSGAQEKNQEQLRSLLRIVHSKFKELNITSYVNLWLALARFRIDPTKYEQTISILLKVLSTSHVFSIGDLNNDEIIRIMVAVTSLKLNNKPLIGEFAKLCQLRMRSFSPDQLVLLTRACVLYVKQFEQFFISIHGECLAKLHLFSYEQKLMLRKTFSRTRILFPDSPLIDTSL